MKRIFLIDKENTGNRFTKGLDKLTSEDVVIVFQWQQGGQIKTEALEALAYCKAKVEVRRFQIHTKNALDFQICTYLGVLYGQYGRNAQYYIVSNDNGYKSAIEFMRNNIDSRARFEIIPTCETEKEEAGDLLSTVLEDRYNRKVRSTIRTGLRTTKDLNGFHTYLQQNLRNDYRNIYMVLKPMYIELKACC